MKRQRASRANSGFTLIELIIAMVIAAMLAAIAIPSYSSYVRKARRTDAKSALLNLASLEERYFSTQNAYSSTATDLGYTAWPATVGSGYYTISMATTDVTAATTTTPATYQIKAVPVAGSDQLKDTQCASFMVNSAGVQSALNSAGVDNSATCWH